ncbi:MAG: hypothetical protein HY644_05835 [Acidobacteria bacterium]|nr:hypothetical protein [Acidobacteriota bacterium]
MAARRRLRMYPGWLPAALTLWLSAGLALFTVYGWILYRITHPRLVGETVRPEQYLLPQREIAWNSRDGSRSSGWFIPGQRGAPLVVLCHGYGSNRTAVLNLATTLRESGYNLLLPALRGHGDNDALCALGWRESEDVNTGIAAVLASERIDSLRVGIWGVTTGAFAALKAAENSDKIVAMALDSVYGNLEFFAGLQAKEIVGFDNIWFRRLLGYGLGWMLRVPETQLRRDIPVEQLFHISSLFIYGLENNSALAAETRRLYTRGGGKKDLIVLGKARGSVLLGNEVKNYDSKILDFFRTALPI